MIGPDLKHAATIAWRELGDLWRERAMMVVTALFALGIPAYLGIVAGSMNLRENYVLVWALDSAIMPIFPAAMMMVHAFISERDQGVLPTLLATPVSNFALFGGKTLPLILLGILQGIGAAAFFLATLVFVYHYHFSAQAYAPLAILPVVVICATLLICGAGVTIASRIRSARSAALALTFASLGILGLEFALGLWLMLDPIGHLVAPDVLASHCALGIASLVIAAQTYRREQIVGLL